MRDVFSLPLLATSGCGGSILGEASSRAVLGPDGEVIRLVNTGRDISERERRG